MLSKLVIISGLSGSGKSVALNAFEDLDYYAIDNLPIKLFEKFSDLLAGSNEFSKVALVMDIRDSQFAGNYPSVFQKILQRFNAEIVFLEAADEILVRRYSETRRKHPLHSKDIAKGITEERRLLNELKDMATTLIDTTAMDSHTLKKRIAEQYSQAGSQKMQVHLISFGFKHSVPKNCDLILDVRFLTNPHFVPELREKTGLDSEIKNFLENDERTKTFMQKTLAYLEYLLPLYAHEGKSYLTIGIGCTGGKHRSVFVAEQLSKQFEKKFESTFPVTVEHQDLHAHA